MPRRCACRRRLCGDGIQPRRISRFLEPALLLLLHRQPAHGYALIEGLDGLGMGAYPADVSAVYRILYDLEEAGMVTSSRESEPTAGPPRRVYALTEAGEAYLAAWVQELRETDRLLHGFLEAYAAHVQQHQDQPQEMAHHANKPSTTSQGETV
jgi:PadR family transcriptional regulator, regulatory protein PadR